MDHAGTDTLDQNPEAVAVDIEALFVAEYANVARKIARIIRDPSRAEELAVEIFLRYSAHNASQPTSATLYRDAVRRALDELRRENRRTRLLALFSYFKNSPSHEAGKDSKARVGDILSRLKQRDAELLMLRAEGLSYSELATALSIKATSVGTLLNRAQDAFRKEYAKRYGEPEF